MCWDFFLGELYRYLPQLVVTFLGVYIAFWIDKRKERNKDEQNRQDLLNDLHSELEVIVRKLTGQGNLHFPDIWQSAISSGQIRLLESEQVRKLARVYREVQAVAYEARRARNLGEAVRTAGRRSPDLKNEWERVSNIVFQRETDLKEDIKELLKEKWW